MKKVVRFIELVVDILELLIAIVVFIIGLFIYCIFLLCGWLLGVITDTVYPDSIKKPDGL